MNMVDKKPKVIVLFEGYSTQIDDATMDANCTCTLITTQRKKIIVDTMTAWDGKEIISGKLYWFFFISKLLISIIIL